MAKAKKKSGQKGVGARTAGRTSSVAKKPDEVHKIGHQVTNVILDNSLEMTRRVVRSVSEEGSITALKFLWETAGLFPSGKAEEEQDSGEVMAKTLLKALGLPLEPPADYEERREEAAAESNVESEEGDEDEETDEPASQGESTLD